MVALARLLEALHVGVELLAREPRGAVHALQLLVACVAAPVDAGDAKHTNRLQPSRVGHMRSAAQVDEVAGSVDADRGDIVGQAVDDVDLEVLVHGREQLDRLRARHHLLHERDPLCGELAHARLDARQVVVDEVRPAGQTEVVEEAVLDGGTDVVLSAGEQLDHRGSHQVGGAVAQDLERRLGRCWEWGACFSGVVDDLVRHATPILRSPPGNALRPRVARVSR